MPIFRQLDSSTARQLDSSTARQLSREGALESSGSDPGQDDSGDPEQDDSGSLGGVEGGANPPSESLGPIGSLANPFSDRLDLPDGGARADHGHGILMNPGGSEGEHEIALLRRTRNDNRQSAFGFHEGLFCGLEADPFRQGLLVVTVGAFFPQNGTNRLCKGDRIAFFGNGLERRGMHQGDDETESEEWGGEVWLGVHDGKKWGSSGATRRSRLITRQSLQRLLGRNGLSRHSMGHVHWPTRSGSHR